MWKEAKKVKLLEPVIAAALVTPLRRLPAPRGGPSEVELAAARGAEADFPSALLAWPQRLLLASEWRQAPA